MAHTELGNFSGKLVVGYMYVNWFKADSTGTLHPVSTNIMYRAKWRG